MTNKTKPLFAACLVGLLALAAFDASAAVAPHPPEEMMEEATHVVRGEVVALTSKTQKSKVERGLLFARDRIYKITIKVSSVEKGSGANAGDEVLVEAWSPSTRFPPMPGPQGQQPVPGKGDLVKTYLLYNQKTKTYQPFMPNGIEILKKAKKGK